jgi:predicted kinase
MLVLLNGPPASGKSTLATRLVESRPLALNLDIDVVRGLLGAWIDVPADAGLAARALAVSMARTHLAAGHDVFVPQFLGRVDFITELERLADQCDVRFVEIGDVDGTLARLERAIRQD